MIYRDKDASKDTIEAPAFRLDPCVHCGEGWSEHIGWFCEQFAPYFLGKQIGLRCTSVPPTQRYETQAMLDSLRRLPAPEPSRECACGIYREDCDYHRAGSAPVGTP